MPNSSDRQFGVDVSDEVAMSLLDAHISAGALVDATVLWPYGQPGQEFSMWKKAPRWSDIKRSRQMLEDFVEATSGRTLNPKKWDSQVAAWFASRKHELSAKAVCRAAYRVRLMLAHLRDAKRSISRGVSTPPFRFRQLRALVDMMRIPKDDEEEEEETAPTEAR